MPLTTVRYSCPECQVTDRPVDVPARGPEDVTIWLRQTMDLIAEDHSEHSPRCTAKTCDVKIPMHRPGARVGAVVVH